MLAAGWLKKQEWKGQLVNQESLGKALPQSLVF